MVDINELKQLISLMNENDLCEIELVHETGRKIRIKKGQDEPVGRMVAMVPAGDPRATVEAQAQASAPKAARDPNLRDITSPMVGTFYRAPSPEADPYVGVGDHVTEETVVCIIEAMKVMNEIKAEKDGEIVEILVENGEPVEFDQPLFRIRVKAGE